MWVRSPTPSVIFSVRLEGQSSLDDHSLQSPSRLLPKTSQRHFSSVIVEFSLFMSKFKDLLVPFVLMKNLNSHSIIKKGGYFMSKTFSLPFKIEISVDRTHNGILLQVRLKTYFRHKWLNFTGIPKSNWFLFVSSTPPIDVKVSSRSLLHLGNSFKFSFHSEFQRYTNIGWLVQTSYLVIVSVDI